MLDSTWVVWGWIERREAGGGWVGLIGHDPDLHLGQGSTLRPDTLMQNAQIRSRKSLADGAGHTFCAARALRLSAPAPAQERVKDLQFP